MKPTFEELYEVLFSIRINSHEEAWEQHKIVIEVWNLWKEELTDLEAQMVAERLEATYIYGAFYHTYEASYRALHSSND